ncbi:MAG: RNA polymerase sigma factor [Pirellulaceae bacterium]
MADRATSNPIAGGVPADSQWLAELYLQHEAGLRRFLVGVLRDAHTAEDILQLTFAKAVQSADTVRPEAIKSWLYRVAFHEAISWKRRVRIDQAAKQVRAARSEQRSEAPDEPLLRRELLDAVRQAIEQLPAKQQQVVRMRIYEEKTFAQISAETGAPLGTVLTHMRRALEKMRQKLKRPESS